MDAVTATLIDGSRAFAMVDQVMWVMLRVGAALMAMPLVGTHAVPARVRVLLAGVLALAFAPLVPTPQWGGLDAAMVLAVLRELALGVVMGMLLRLAFEAGALAGALIAQGSGLAFAQMNDPLRGVASGVLGQWFYLAFGLVFFASDGHLALVELVLRSYQNLPVGAPLSDVSLLLAAVPEFVPSVLRAGLALALPVTVALLAVNLAFGVLARAAPALNPIQLGLPVSVLVGLLLLLTLSGELAPPVQRLFHAAFEAAEPVARP